VDQEDGQLDREGARARQREGAGDRQPREADREQKAEGGEACGVPKPDSSLIDRNPFVFAGGGDLSFADPNARKGWADPALGRTARPPTSLHHLGLRSPGLSPTRSGCGAVLVIRPPRHLRRFTRVVLGRLAAHDDRAIKRIVLPAESLASENDYEAGQES
jgi:hypothetical protein